MKKLLTLTISLLVVFSVPALAAGKITVTQESFYVRPYWSNFASEIYAELTNTGDKPVKFNGGMIELFNEDGDSIESSNIYSCYPPILGPGEVGYIFDTTSVKEAEEKSYIDDYVLTVTSKGENKETIKYLPSDGTYLEEDRNFFKELRISATIQNDTDSTLEKVTVAIALYDADDKLIYADYVSPYSIGVPSGQSIVFYTRVDNRIYELWETEGISPARVVTIAYSED